MCEFTTEPLYDFLMAAKITKKHHIVYVMAYMGLNGGNHRQILRSAWYLQHGTLAGFKPESNRCYFLGGKGNGDSVSLIRQGFVKRTARCVYELTPKGHDLATRLIFYSHLCPRQLWWKNEKW